MRVFISWSGSMSHRVAMALRDWLPSVVHSVEPWVSSEDIEKGARWSAEIGRELEATSFGIVCLVPGNLREPWIHFEAGAIARSVEAARVCPLLVGVTRADLPGPLALFQSTLFEQEEVRKLVHSLNRAGPNPTPDDRLNRTFDLCWGGLKAQIAKILDSHEETPPTSDLEPPEPTDISEDEENVLARIVVFGDRYPDSDHLARALGETPVRAQYQLDRLRERGFVHPLHSMVAPTRYMLTQEGRAYLVEHGLV